MITSDELALRLLAELEEDADTVPAMMNTLLRGVAAPVAIPLTKRALQSLVQDNLAWVIEFGRAAAASSKSREASLAAIDKLDDLVTFNSETGWWDGKYPARGDDNWITEIALTPLGRERCYAILKERGYRWWAQKNST